MMCPENCGYEPKDCMIQDCGRAVEMIYLLEEENMVLNGLVSRLEALVAAQNEVIRILK
jgi:hypothetical protein